MAFTIPSVLHFGYCGRRYVETWEIEDIIEMAIPYLEKAVTKRCPIEKRAFE